MYQPDMICFENDFETPGEKSVHFERSPFWYMYTRTSILINQWGGKWRFSYGLYNSSTFICSGRL